LTTLATAIQLPLALQPDARAFVLGSTRSLHVETRLDDAGFRVRLAPSTAVNPVELVLRVRAPAGLWLDGRAVWRWTMARGLPLRPGDALSELTSAAFRSLYPHEPPDEWWLTRGVYDEPARIPPGGREEASETMRGLYRTLRELAIAAVDRCDPAARALAMRFPVHVRLTLYARVLDDRSGCLAQLATTCPGALTYALAVVERGAWLEPIGERLLAGVTAGARLGPLLGDAIGAWMEGCRRAAERPVDVGGEPAELAVLDGPAAPAEHNAAEFPLDLAWVAQLAGPEARTLLERQRLLVRRAGPGVPATLLLAPPPAAFAPEDIPRPVRANARWYRVMKHRALRPVPDDERGRARAALCRFASRHALALWRLAERHEVSPLLSDLLDYVTAAHVSPGRSTDPQHLLAASRRWHANWAWLPQADPDRARPIGELSFPEPPLARWTDQEPHDAEAEVAKAHVTVRAVKTPNALIEESAHMHHCVATYAPAIAAGRSWIFHADVAGQALTIEAERRVARFVLRQVRGVDNRQPTAAELRALGPWLAALNADQGAVG